MKYKTLWLIVLGMLSVILILKGCEDGQKDRTSSDPEGTGPQTIILQASDSMAKAAGWTIEAVGVDEFGREIGPRIDPIVIDEELGSPFNVPIILYRPPCRHRITLTVDLLQGQPRTESIIVDICEETTGEITFSTFEEFTIGEIVIEAPDPVNAGETATVTCAIRHLNAPDIDRYPVFATLSELGGESVTGPIDEHSLVSGQFPDPFPLTSFEGRRVFTCTIEDGRSPSQTVEKVMTRIPPVLPTPTPTPTSTLTPIPPTLTPTPTPTPIPPTPTPTPTPTPLDSDGDGIPDVSDICPFVPDPLQIATDDDANCRFIDNGNGTITDSTTGLIWLQNANCFGLREWETPLYSGNFPAADACNTLASGACGLTDGSNPGDWHLPSMNELTSLLDYAYLAPVLHPGHPFTNVGVGQIYWSSIEIGINAWGVNTGNGTVAIEIKETPYYVWPVR